MLLFFKPLLLVILVLPFLNDLTVMRKYFIVFKMKLLDVLHFFFVHFSGAFLPVNCGLSRNIRSVCMYNKAMWSGGSGCRMVRHSQDLGQKYYQKTQTQFLRPLSYSTIEWFNCDITGQFHPICGEGIYNKHMNVLTNERQYLSQYCEIVNPLSSVYPAPKWIIFD